MSGLNCRKHLASRTFPVHRPLGHLYILKDMGQDPKRGGTLGLKVGQTDPPILQVVIGTYISSRLDEQQVSLH